MPAKTFKDILKFNPNHDERGRFASAGGGGAGKKTDSALFARAQFKEIADKAEKIADAARTELGVSAFGLRVQEHDTETVGASMTHRSQNFGGDFEDAHGAEYREELDGVSTIGLSRVGETGEFGGYSGTIAYLIGGEQSTPGYDPGEDIIKEPVVLAKFGYKDGKLIILDAIKHDQKATESEKPNSGTDAPKPNKEYTNFMAQMAQKYGADEMYSKMTDSEFDKYQHLEMHRFDKSAGAKTVEDVHKTTALTGCGVLVLRDGRLLTGERIERAGNGRVCGPGGHIEQGESPEEAARREAMEEFGIRCGKLIRVGTVTSDKHGGSAIFLCTDFSGQPKTDEVEMTKPRWRTINDLRNDELFPPFEQSLRFVPQKTAKTFAEVLKFNPNHDEKGRFSSGSGLATTTFSTGASGDQVNMRAEMRDGDKIAGYVEYSVYNDTPAIQYIHTSEDYARRGVATQLMQDIQRKYPDKEIEFGMTTPDGTKFLDSITHEVKNEKVAAQKQKLTEAKSKLSQNETEMERLYDKLDNNTITEAEKKKLNDLGEQWDDLDRQIHEIESSLKGQKETKRMVKLPELKKSKERFEIYKADDDKHLVFGWASIAITVDGEVLEDRQHDTIEPEELEEAAYDYVLDFRETGEEHMPDYRKKGRLVESCVFTEEKQKAMGIPKGILPVGWWIGFKIDDEDTWRRIKNGTYRMFSIEGKAQREPLKDEVKKFNPNHDDKGRFSSGSGGATAESTYAKLSSPEVTTLVTEMGQSLSKEDEAATAGYFGTGNAFKLNRKLRDGADPSEFAKADKRTCSALDRNMKPLTRDIALTRFIKDGFFEQFGLSPETATAEDLDSMVGKVFKNKGYTSTSFDTSKNLFKSRAIRLNIHAPKGTKALVRPSQKEAEILLARNTAMVIKGVRKTGEKTFQGNPIFEVDVEVLVD